MIPKRTITDLADNMYRQYCKELDKKLESSLRTALGSKRISKERQNIIVNEFCDYMQGAK